MSLQLVSSCWAPSSAHSLSLSLCHFYKSLHSVFSPVQRKMRFLFQQFMLPTPPLKSIKEIEGLETWATSIKVSILIYVGLHWETELVGIVKSPYSQSTRPIHALPTSIMMCITKQSGQKGNSEGRATQSSKLGCKRRLYRHRIDIDIYANSQLLKSHRRNVKFTRASCPGNSSS